MKKKKKKGGKGKGKRPDSDTDEGYRPPDSEEGTVAGGASTREDIPGSRSYLINGSCSGACADPSSIGGEEGGCLQNSTTPSCKNSNPSIPTTTPT